MNPEPQEAVSGIVSDIDSWVSNDLNQAFADVDR
jgi:hypothetical protein